MKNIIQFWPSIKLFRNHQRRLHSKYGDHVPSDILFLVGSSIGHLIKNAN